MPSDAPHQQQSVDAAQYRICEICKEPGADVITYMYISESGGGQSRYAHRPCAATAEISAVDAPASAPTVLP
ncbi:hypothetical protein [Streptomyces sp. CBMA152]|uniref:hypothetical protein n=1 Tax=Streptomyces sp. CBMA152 TaxID=1896312 RepID=UPI001660537C|nr:hypothetical protein [Streptomyces sp. CBMA152]